MNATTILKLELTSIGLIHSPHRVACERSRAADRRGPFRKRLAPK